MLKTERRRFTADYGLRILAGIAEADACTQRGEIGLPCTGQGSTAWASIRGMGSARG